MRDDAIHDTTDAHCALDWCTTPHGRTQHVDDEQHRSDGVATVLEHRVPHGPVRAQLVEAGLVRHATDDTTWLAFELDDGPAVEVTLASAQRVLRALRADPAVAAALGLPP